MVQSLSLSESLGQPHLQLVRDGLQLDAFVVVVQPGLLLEGGKVLELHASAAKVEFLE
jgi:hypothetical protein